MKLTKQQEAIIFQDFEEKPVDIMTFLLDRKYLGNSWRGDNDEVKLFPFWQEQIQKFYPLPMRSPYSILLLQGGTGLGKTSFAVCAVLAYYLYLTICLKDPHEYFGLAKQKKITFAFLNIVTKTIAYKNAWGMLHRALLASPWFMEHGGRTASKDNPEWICRTKPIDLLYGGSPNDVIGLDILGAFFDEISFARIRDPKRAQEQAMELFNAAYERMTSRFIKFGGLFEGLAIMASSKRTDQAFLEVFAEKLLKSADGNRVFIVDKPRWEVLPPGTYSGKTFPFAYGDKFMPPTIIKPSEVQTYRDAGYEIIYPPIETLGAFERDTQKAMTDIAGISSLNQMRFLRGDYIKRVINTRRQNPFLQSIIYVGKKDKIQYSDYFNLTRCHKEDFKKPLFIHIDASLGGDGNCISGVNVEYAKYQIDASTGESIPVLCYEQIFKVKVLAPKGDEVMLTKNEQFIYWLRQQGFNIALVTSDNFQSVALRQNLERAGFNVRYQSIDRVEKGVNEPYRVLKEAIYEQRIKLLDDEDQTTELSTVEKYEDGRVDKCIGGTDDAAQALAGAVYGASQCKEEYLRNNIVLIDNASSSLDEETPSEQEIANIIAQQFSYDYLSPIGATKVQKETGIRETFDRVMGTKPPKKAASIASRFF